MSRWTLCALLWAVTLSAQQDRDPNASLARIQENVREGLAHLPSYLCLETVERAYKETAKEAFELRDTLRLEVTLIGNQERFAWRNARKLEDKELRDLVGKG